MIQLLRSLGLLHIIFFVSLFGMNASAEPVSNVRSYRVTEDIVVIYYDLDTLYQTSISAEISIDGGKTYILMPPGLSGDIGNTITPGIHKRIEWQIGSEFLPVPENIIVNITTDSAALSVENQTDTIIAFPSGRAINIDGILNEEAWSKAEIITGFTQRELFEGAPASEKTEVRTLYDEDNLYIGVMCYDSEPDKIVHSELKWDGNIWGDDHFILTLDTYNDKRNGYYFVVNPNGARLDATIVSGYHAPMNTNWNCIWDVSSRITNEGWSCEIIIPFKSLRFTDLEKQVWGINFMRKIPRKSEEMLWRAWGRTEGVRMLSKAGKLIIDNTLKKSAHLDVKPYVLSGSEKKIYKNADDVFRYGLDIKYGITSNTTLDLTTRTDFAQIESDAEVINLSRFSIQYPEKRDFFLESANMFEFGIGGTKLFYSRKIGISPNRSEIPILGGAKLTQKAGSFQLGVITMQTEEKDGNPGANHTVLRAKKDIFEQSYIGFMGTNIIDSERHDNQSYGVDFEYKTDKFVGNKNFLVSGYLAGTVDDGDHKNSLDKRFSIDYPNDLYTANITVHSADRNFNPGVGFINRAGIMNYRWSGSFNPRPSIPLIKQLEISPYNIFYETDSAGKFISRRTTITPLGISFNSEDSFNFTINNSYDYVEKDFVVFEDVTIFNRAYEWWFYTMGFSIMYPINWTEK